MVTSNVIHVLTLSTMQQVSLERLQRAVCGLADGSITVSLTRQSERELRALVTNGDSKEYGVTITETLTTCSCKDALYCGEICKHATAVAVHVLRSAPATLEKPASPKPIFHLMWREGVVLCGIAHPERVWVWPWTDYMVTWPEACPACVAAYRQPKTTQTVAA